MPKISFILLTYYPKPEIIKRLLESLDQFDVFLIDNTPEKNFSFESICTQILKLSRSVKLLDNCSNLGYAGGVNKGLKTAMQNGYEWMVILNDDIQMPASSVQLLIKELNELNGGIAGPYPQYLDRNRWTTSTNPIFNNQKSDFQYLSGSFLAIHRDVLREIGFLFEPFFLYYEEVDFCIRAAKKGIPMNYLKLNNLIHHETSSLGRGSFLHNYYLCRNHLLFVNRQAPFNVKIHELLRLPKSIFEYLKVGDRASLIGLKDYFLGSFGQYKGEI
jgi:GT2 family glycosyltransferase